MQNEQIYIKSSYIYSFYKLLLQPKMLKHCVTYVLGSKDLEYIKFKVKFGAAIFFLKGHIRFRSRFKHQFSYFKLNYYRYLSILGLKFAIQGHKQCSFKIEVCLSSPFQNVYQYNFHNYCFIFLDNHLKKRSSQTIKNNRFGVFGIQNDFFRSYFIINFLYSFSKRYTPWFSKTYITLVDRKQV